MARTSQSENWQHEYAKQRSDNLSEQSYSMDQNIEDDGFNKKKRFSQINPMNDYQNNAETAGIETMNAMDNVVFGNAALAYVVGRNDAKSNSQLQLKLRDSQDISKLQRNSSVDSHILVQQKTPSSHNTSSFMHRSSNSDATVSTNVLFESPNSGAPSKGKQIVYNNSKNSLLIPKRPLNINNVGQTQEETIDSYYKHHNMTKPLPISEVNSNANRSFVSHSSQNLSARLQQMDYQRKTKKGHKLNIKHLSVYQPTKSDNQQISQEIVEFMTKLEVFHNCSLKAVLLAIFIPVVVPIVTLMIPKSQFLKWITSKDTTLLDMDLERMAEENPYSDLSSYHSNELGYFGIISMGLELKLKKQDDNKINSHVSMNKIAEHTGERHVGFSETPVFIPVVSEINDPIYVDIDYTRLKHYLDTVTDLESCESEFLQICLSNWNSFISKLHIALWIYFAIWIVAAICCIVLIPILNK